MPSYDASSLHPSSTRTASHRVWCREYWLFAVRAGILALCIDDRDIPASHRTDVLFEVLKTSKNTKELQKALWEQQYLPSAEVCRKDFPQLPRGWLLLMCIQCSKNPGTSPEQRKIHGRSNCHIFWSWEAIPARGAVPSGHARIKHLLWGIASRLHIAT